MSLICKITVTICYPTCKKCTTNKVGSLEEQFCQECITNYFPLDSDSHNVEYNCYSSSDAEVSSYYNDGGVFYPCHISCKRCNNNHSCLSCKDGYYFKFDKQTNDICYSSTVDNYYFDYNSLMYKECYESCSSCINSGTLGNNNCLTCKTGKYTYPFNEHQCLSTNIETCINSNNYWELKNNNIICTNCDKKTVLYGDNRGQCVDDCQNYVNPHLTKTFFFTLKNCGGKDYCIPLDICINGHFNVDYEKKECHRIGECNIDFFDDDDPFEHDNDPIPTDIESDKEESSEEKRESINKRFKVFKMFRNDYNYSLWYKFDFFIIQDYIKLLKKELENYVNSEIYLITTTEYDNFTITIYPLDIEEFVYDQIFAPNNLGFINFTKTFSNFIDYEVNKKCLILIILLESHLTNSSIHDLNYYFYSFNEKNDNGNYRNEIKISEDTYLTNNESKLEVLYPLYSYYDENSNINKRNSELLVDNIKSMYFKYPDIVLYNISDPFYNDICNIYTSEVNTDMSLNDRRSEYFVNISLCENNCYLVKILNKDLKNPRSLCNCDIKKEFMYNNKAYNNYTIPKISTYNSKAVKCISQAFNKNSISSNPIFWIFIIVLLFLIILLIRWIFYGSKEIRRILKISKPNQDDSKIKISSESNEISEINDISKNNSLNNKEDLNLKNKQKKDLAKSMGIPDNNKKRLSNNDIDSQKIEYLSAPLEQSAPPKKKIKRNQSLVTKAENNKAK